MDLVTYCFESEENTCELNFWSWHYHPIMGSIQNMDDAPPNSLKDSNASLEVKTMEGVGVCSLTCNTSR
jgi:hypothetical protein